MADLDDEKSSEPNSVDSAGENDAPPIESLRIVGLPATTLAIWIIAALGIAVRLWFIVGLRFMEEDSLITLRYAQNFWSHGQLTYNLGERVIGFTSPAWTLIMVPLGGPFGFRTSQILITGLCLLLYGTSFYIALRILDELGFAPAAKIFVALALAFHASITAESVSGMEMSLYLLLVLGSALAAIRDRRVLAFGIAALGTLTRPEGAIWWIALFAFVWMTNRRQLLRKSIPISVAVVAPWLVVATLYYGTFIPQSAMSKSQWLSGGGSLLTALWQPSQLFAIGLLMSGSTLWGLPTAIQLTALAVSLAIWGWGVAIAIRQKHHVVVLFASYWVAIVLFYYLGRGIVFPWYGFVPNVLFVIVAAEVFNEITAKIRMRFQTAPDRHRRNQIRLAAWAFSVIAIAGFVAMMALKTASWIEVRQYEDGVFRPVGEFIAECSAPGSRVMLEPLGYIGYFSQRDVYDLAGLVSPEFAPSEEKSKAGWGIKQIRTYMPDFIVLRRYEIPENKFFAAFNAQMFSEPAERDWLASHYREVASYGADDRGLLVFARSDVTLTCESRAA